MENRRTRTVEAMRRAILNGEMAPGERLQPMALAEQLGSSTSVIREALTALVGDGLVTSSPNRGFFVRQLDLEDLRDLTELRCATESIAARLAMKRGELDWEAQLAAAHHRLTRAPRRRVDDPSHINPEWEVEHRAFHQAILAGCNNEPILRLASNLADATELYRRWAAPSSAAAHRDVEHEHAEIFAAAVARDPDLLAERLQQHYRATVTVVLDAGLSASADR
jgi:DNA-binding GntR family transcriptional regulator